MVAAGEDLAARRSVCLVARSALVDEVRRRKRGGDRRALPALADWEGRIAAGAARVRVGLSPFASEATERAIRLGGAGDAVNALAYSLARDRTEEGLWRVVHAVARREGEGAAGLLRLLLAADGLTNEHLGCLVHIAPLAVLAHPAYDIEDYRFWVTAGPALARRPDTPESVLAVLGRKAIEGVISAPLAELLVGNPSTPADTVLTLALAGGSIPAFFPFVGAALRHPRMPADPGDKLRAIWAFRLAAEGQEVPRPSPPAIRWPWAESLAVRWYEESPVSADDLQRIAALGPFGARFVAHFQALPLSVLVGLYEQRLARDNDAWPGVGEVLAERHDLDDDLRRRLAPRYPRETLANPTTSASLLAELVGTINQHRTGVACLLETRGPPPRSCASRPTMPGSTTLMPR